MEVFRIGDIPIRVSMWYGMLLFYWFRGGATAETVVWAVVVTASILVHELGHALVARHYRLNPGILLHGLGGLCQHDRAERDLHDVMIIGAGPVAGLLLGGATWVFETMAPAQWSDVEWFDTAIEMSLYVNLGWSLVNLLPIWPLDGGQLYRLLMLRVFRPVRAERITHVTALALLLLAFATGYYKSGTLLPMLIVWVAFSNIAALRGDQASGPIRAHNKAAKQLLHEAKQAFERQDFKESARLGELLRREANVSDGIVSEGLRILGLSCARIGDHSAALTYLRREKASLPVTEARIECLYALGLDKDLQHLLDSDDFRKIPEPRRKEILEIVRSGK